MSKVTSPEVSGYKPLSDEEKQVLKECRDESFWYRCVPLVATGCVGVTVLRNLGIITPHPKYGLAFKIAGAVLGGFFIGKLSYVNKCKEKLEKVPNSRFAKKHLSQDDGFQASSCMAEEPASQRQVDNYESSSYSAPDTYQQSPTHVDSSHPVHSYDEMRELNRKTYEDKTRPYSTIQQPAQSAKDYNRTTSGRREAEPGRPLEQDIFSNYKHTPRSEKAAGKYGDSEFN